MRPSADCSRGPVHTSRKPIASRGGPASIGFLFVFPGGAFTLAARCIVLLALRLDLCQGQYCPQRTLISWRSPRGGGIPGFDHTGHSSSRGVVVRTYIYTSYKLGSVGSPRINLGCRTLQNFLGLLPATWLNRIIFGFAELRIHIRNSLPREFISGIHGV